MIPLDPCYEWVGSIAGMAGAVLMAARIRLSPWAYPVWLLSSSAMLVFALRAHHYGLAAQQGVFTAANLFGVLRWLSPAGRLQVAWAEKGETTRSWR